MPRLPHARQAARFGRDVEGHEGCAPFNAAIARVSAKFETLRPAAASAAAICPAEPSRGRRPAADSEKIQSVRRRARRAERRLATEAA